ncbi:winged helix-turn-helix transcriptional regulator [Flavobacterium sp.]|uniref:winged helix-turn-helix transcriptional regulator n=1 Tax=Flavobacterium sp. TaxID=239 RepID=UPI00375298F6
MKTEEINSIPTQQECKASLKNIIDAMYVLSGKWKLPIVLSLMHSTKRFNEIQKEVIGISPKVLANELRDLEANFLISRHVDTATPVVITYGATDYSQTLKNVLPELSAWGKQHREKIKESMKK